MKLQWLSTQKGKSASSTSENEVKKKNRPKETPVRQQRLPGWQPIVSAWSLITIVSIIGVVCIAVGIFVTISSLKVKEIVIRYDKCSGVKCKITIDLIKHFNDKRPVYFYYELENFFQNYRLYAQSKSNQQLRGDLDNKNDAGCAAPWANQNPCGAIASSMFNDTFNLTVSRGTGVEWTSENVVWEVDKDVKFSNPGINKTVSCKSQRYSDLKAMFEGKWPRNWNNSLRMLFLGDANASDTCNAAFLNPDFMIWMRTAAMPKFRKLYRILNDSFQIGEYTLEIDNNYNVSKFYGKKYFVISTVNWAGCYDILLGISYMVAGILCLIINVIFLPLYKKLGYIKRSR